MRSTVRLLRQFHKPVLRNMATSGPALANGGTTQDAFTKALTSNKQWASHMQKTQSELLTQLGKGQAPPILWIGCSDSRVPETTLLGLQPGDVFVHRNIANVITAHDLSSTAAITFAVGTLKVQHVVLCGHRSCGGVVGALGNASLGGVLDAWLAPVRRLRADMTEELQSLEPAARVDVLVKANVRSGIRVLRENPTVIQAVKERGLQLHGLVYDVGSGELEVLEVDEVSAEESKRLDAFGLQ